MYDISVVNVNSQFHMSFSPVPAWQLEYSVHDRVKQAIGLMTMLSFAQCIGITASAGKVHDKKID